MINKKCKKCNKEFDKCPTKTKNCSKILSLHCKTCDRYYCDNHWDDANDEFCKYTEIENGIYQAPGCDYCDNHVCDNC